MDLSQLQSAADSDGLYMGCDLQMDLSRLQSNDWATNVRYVVICRWTLVGYSTVRVAPALENDYRLSYFRYLSSLIRCCGLNISGRCA